MTSTDLAVQGGAHMPLPVKIEYAKMLAASGLLPREYRQQPANVLYAYEYGELLGLPAMAAITGIHVIDGRPSISAGLISALVRRAGHRLRVTGDDTQAQAQLVRADDPGFTYKSTWTIDRAKKAGLLGKSNWQHYPAAMLKARAISEVARDACQEVMLGMQYTPDELGADDDGGEIVHDGFPARADGMLNASQMTEEEKEAAGLMSRPQRVGHEALRRDGQPPVGAVEVLQGTPEDDPWQAAEPVTRPQLTKLGAIFTNLGFASAERDQRLAVVSQIVGRELGSSKDLTKREAMALIDTLEQFGPDRGRLIELLASERGEASDG